MQVQDLNKFVVRVELLSCYNIYTCMFPFVFKALKLSRYDDLVGIFLSKLFPY